MTRANPDPYELPLVSLVDPRVAITREMWNDHITATNDIDQEQVNRQRLDQMDAPDADVAMAGFTLTGLREPLAADEPATKAYADAIATGLDVKASVRVATTANMMLTGTPMVDGVDLGEGDRVLVKDQTDASENGVYVTAWNAWTRAEDADSDAEVNTGMFVLVTEGATNGAKGFILITAEPITVDTTGLAFTQFNQVSSLAAGSLGSFMWYAPTGWTARDGWYVDARDHGVTGSLAALAAGNFSDEINDAIQKAYTDSTGTASSRVIVPINGTVGIGLSDEVTAAGNPTAIRLRQGVSLEGYGPGSPDGHAGTELKALSSLSTHMIQWYYDDGTNYNHWSGVTEIRLECSAQTAGDAINVNKGGEVQKFDRLLIGAAYRDGIRFTGQGTPCRVGDVSIFGCGRGAAGGGGIHFYESSGTTNEIGYISGDNNYDFLVKATRLGHGRVVIHGGKAEIHTLGRHNDIIVNEDANNGQIVILGLNVSPQANVAGGQRAILRNKIVAGGILGEFKILGEIDGYQSGSASPLDKLDAYYTYGLLNDTISGVQQSPNLTPTELQRWSYSTRGAMFARKVTSATSALAYANNEAVNILQGRIRMPGGWDILGGSITDPNGDYYAKAGSEYTCTADGHKWRKTTSELFNTGWVQFT